MLKINKSLILVIILITNFVASYNGSGSINTNDLGTSTFSVASSLVLPRSTTELTVHAVNNSGIVVGADIVFQAPEGVFTTNGNSQATVVTDASGDAKVNWVAPDLAFNQAELNVTFQADIQNGLETLTLYAWTIVKNYDTTLISHSELNVPTVVLSGSQAEFSVLVADTNDVVTPNASVTYTDVGAFGTFTSDTQGSTNSSGYFTVSWDAPTLGVNENELSIEISAFVEIGPVANITLVKDFLVRKILATDLNVTLTSQANEIVSGGTLPLEFLVLANTTAAYGGTLVLTVDSGEFNNSLTQISLDINSTGYVTVDWTAPDVTQNASVLFSAVANLDILTGTLDFSVQVYPLTHYFNVTLDLSKAHIAYDEILVVTVTVHDNDSSAVVQNAEVKLSTDTGEWTESGDIEAILHTDANGVVVGHFNGSDANLLIAQQSLNLNVTVQKDNYETKMVGTTFILDQKPGNYGFTATLSSTTIDYGQMVSITMTATDNGLPYSDATFHVVASGNAFTNGESAIYNQTDVNGVSVVVWDSNQLPVITEDLPIYFVITLVNSGLPNYQLNLTVSPSTNFTSDNTNTGGGGSGSNVSTGIIIGGAAIVAIIGIGTYVFKKK